MNKDINIIKLNASVGYAVGKYEGETEGSIVGIFDGIVLGTCVGEILANVGTWLGFCDKVVGLLDGWFVGVVGFMVGLFMHPKQT